MTGEYARHNGHADLIRELVDGEVGCGLLKPGAWRVAHRPHPSRTMRIS
jgi:Protein of unknown function (DUF664)